MSELLDCPIKQRERGFGVGDLVVGIAAAQLTTQGFWSDWTECAPMSRYGRWCRLEPSTAAALAVAVARPRALAWCGDRVGGGLEARMLALLLSPSSRH